METQGRLGSDSRQSANYDLIQDRQCEKKYETDKIWIKMFCVKCLKTDIENKKTILTQNCNDIFWFHVHADSAVYTIRPSIEI